MDTPAYSMPGIRQITQLSPTPQSVITLGHSPNVPLMRPASELGDGFEPHGHIPPGNRPPRTRVAGHGDQRGREEVYPGWEGWVGTREGIPGTHPPVVLRPV